MKNHPQKNRNKKEAEKIKILIAEDDRISSKILEKNIKEWGYQVIITRNGKQAWNTLQQQDVQIILLDWMMPKLDGIQLCQRIRETKTDIYKYIIMPF